MGALGRNRVFTLGDIERLKQKTDQLMELAVEISKTFNQSVDQLTALAGSIPPEAGPNLLKMVLPQYQKNYILAAYDDTKSRADRLLQRIMDTIPQKDADSASELAALTEQIEKAKLAVEELKALLAPGTLSLPFPEFQAITGLMFLQNKELTDSDKQELSAGTLGYVEGCSYIGDPVNAATGNFLFAETDLEIEGIPYLSFRRYYDSLNRKKGIFGRGWRSSYEITLKDQEGGYLYRTKEGGSVFEKPHCRMYFTAEEKLERIEDQSGRGVSLKYDRDGNLKEAESDEKRRLTFHYEAGRIAGISDDTGRKVTYEYCKSGLRAVTDPMGNIHSYEYGKESNRIEKLIDENGTATLSNRYDKERRVICQTLPDGEQTTYSYPTGRNYTQAVYPDHHVERYYHDGLLKGTLVLDGEGNILEKGRQYRYEDRARVLKRELKTQKDMRGNIIRLKRGEGYDEISYGDNGYPDRIHLWEGGSFTFTYDALGRITQKTDGNGNTREYTYDACSRLTRTDYPDGSAACYTYDPAGKLIRAELNTGEAYTFTYDSRGRVTGITEADGKKLTLSYNKAGELEKIENSENLLWREPSLTEETELPLLEIKPREMKPVQTACDGAGNTIMQIFPDGRKYDYTYDCMDRLTTAALNKESTYTFRYETFAGQKNIQMTDPMGNTTEYRCDSHGRLTAVKDAAGEEFTLKEREELPRKEKEPQGAVPSFTEEKTEKTWDTGIKEIRDEAGRLKERHCPGEILSRYEYTKEARIARIVHKRGEETLEELAYEYDRNGNCTTIQKYRKDCPEDSGSFSYEYDALGRLIRSTHDGKETAAYRYDRYGNRTEKKKKGTTTSYRYDSGNRLCYTDEQIPEIPKEKIKILCRQGKELQKTYQVQKGKESWQVIYNGLPEAVITGEEVKYLLTDHLGSVLRVTLQDGRTESIHSYDEFGASLGESPRYAGYAGYIPEGESLYLTKTRYYAPSLGRFLTRDTWKGRKAQPQTWNQWVYGLNNPVRYKDETGYMPEESLAGAAVGKAGHTQRAGSRHTGNSMQGTSTGCDRQREGMGSGCREYRTECAVGTAWNLMNLYKPSRNTMEERARLQGIHTALNHPGEAENACIDSLYLNSQPLFQPAEDEGKSLRDIWKADENGSPYTGKMGSTVWDLFPCELPYVPYQNASLCATMATYTICQYRASGMGDKGNEPEPILIQSAGQGTESSQPEAPRAGRSSVLHKETAAAPGMTPARPAYEYTTEMTLDKLISDAVNGHTVTAKDMLSLPVAEMISMEEFGQRVKEEKIEKWADPSYVLTRQEKKEAKGLIKEFYREEYDRFDMDEEARQKTYKIVMLENKTNPGAGVMAGIMEEMPFSGKMIKVLDNEYRKMEEASGIEGGYNVSETMQALENQSPTAYMSGRIITEGAEFYAGAKLFAKIPVVKKISNAVGAKAAAAAGRKGLSTGAQQMIAARTSEIVSGKMFDTATDTVPNVIKDVRQGEELPEIGKHALVTEAKDLAIGVGSEAAAGAVSIAFSKIGKALRGGNEAVEGIVREGAEEAQELIEGGVTAKAASVPEVKPKPELNSKANAAVEGDTAIKAATAPEVKAKPELEKGEVEKAVSVPEAKPKPKSKPRLENDTVEKVNPVPKEEPRQRYDQEFEGGLDANIHPVRIADEALDGDLLKNANAMKDKLPTWAKNKGNFGYGEVDIEGVDNTQFFAHSSIQTEIPSVKDSGISIKPESSPFKTVEVNGSNVINGEGAWPRDVDTEYKILSDIQSKLSDNYSASGKIKLYTELEPCPSCQSVIKQFKEMYPNIDIEVIYSIEK